MGAQVAGTDEVALGVERELARDDQQRRAVERSGRRVAVFEVLRLTVLEQVTIDVPRNGPSSERRLNP
jgi:hypothetical protein